MAYTLEELIVPIDHDYKRKAKLRPFPMAFQPEYPEPQCIQTLCDVCKNAYGFCEWSEKGNMRPVPGWDAVRRDVTTILKQVGRKRFYTKTISYVVLHCPKFELESHRKAWFQRWDPEKRRRELTRK